MKFPIVIAAILIGLTFFLLKYDYIVLDRNVFDFQISHILKRGKINNLREYNAILNSVEQRFEQDNEGFASDPTVEKLNELLAAYDQESAQTTD